MCVVVLRHNSWRDIGLSGSPAFAQEPTADVAAPAGQDGILDIVVTARKREETLPSVPVAVTAITPAQLMTHLPTI